MKLSKGEREGTKDSEVHPEPQEICKLSRERRPWACSILALVLPNTREEEMTRLGEQSPTSGEQEPGPSGQASWMIRHSGRGLCGGGRGGLPPWEFPGSAQTLPSRS